MFKVGQKVVCVDDRHSNDITMAAFKQWVKRDEQYTIRVVRPHAADGGVLLEEIKNPPKYIAAYAGNLEPAFHPRRFIAVEEFKGEEVVALAKEILKEEVYNVSL